MQWDKYYTRDLLFGVMVFFIVPACAPVFAGWISGWING